MKKITETLVDNIIDATTREGRLATEDERIILEKAECLGMIDETIWPEFCWALGRSAFNAEEDEMLWLWDD